MPTTATKFAYQHYYRGNNWFPYNHYYRGYFKFAYQHYYRGHYWFPYHHYYGGYFNFAYQHYYRGNNWFLYKHYYRGYFKFAYQHYYRGHYWSAYHYYYRGYFKFAYQHYYRDNNWFAYHLYYRGYYKFAYQHHYRGHNWFAFQHYYRGYFKIHCSAFKHNHTDHFCLAFFHFYKGYFIFAYHDFYNGHFFLAFHQFSNHEAKFGAGSIRCHITTTVPQEKPGIAHETVKALEDIRINTNVARNVIATNLTHLLTKVLHINISEDAIGVNNFVEEIAGEKEAYEQSPDPCSYFRSDVCPTTAYYFTCAGNGSPSCRHKCEGPNGQGLCGDHGTCFFGLQDKALACKCEVTSWHVYHGAQCEQTTATLWFVLAVSLGTGSAFLLILVTIIIWLCIRRRRDKKTHGVRHLNRCSAEVADGGRACTSRQNKKLAPQTCLPFFVSTPPLTEGSIRCNIETTVPQEKPGIAHETVKALEDIRNNTYVTRDVIATNLRHLVFEHFYSNVSGNDIGVDEIAGKKEAYQQSSDPCSYFRTDVCPTAAYYFTCAMNVTPSCNHNRYDDSTWDHPGSGGIGTLRDLSFRSQPDKTSPFYGRYHRQPGHVNQAFEPVFSGNGNGLRGAGMYLPTEPEVDASSMPSFLRINTAADIYDTEFPTDRRS
ncbi:hypothetical protein MAR_035035 [Mya arenaria]|uniref:Uncharacterized protein n=1 Tax=Mya arenaria TaxID=6604 RepID=A0ABY7ELG0_MYAAR|nr:hypothetical protein MAR_035035 [Mya arenaria]